MSLEIAQLGQPVLWERAEEVEPAEILSPAFQEFLREMHATLLEQKGVGLAAPQVFEGVRVFLGAILPPDEPDGFPNVEAFINPRLTPLTQEMKSGWEGCLSFPELLVLVPRYRAVRIDYIDAKGLASTQYLLGFQARVIQHEHDHLDGILTIDRAESKRDIIKASELEAVLEERSEPADEEPEE